MFERIVRDISLIFNEFTVAPSWTWFNKFLRLKQIDFAFVIIEKVHSIVEIEQDKDYTRLSELRHKYSTVHFSWKAAFLSFHLKVKLGLLKIFYAAACSLTGSIIEKEVLRCYNLTFFKRIVEFWGARFFSLVLTLFDISVSVHESKGSQGGLVQFQESN